MTDPVSSPDTDSVVTAEIDTATQDVKPAETSAAEPGEQSLVAKIQAALAPKETPDSKSKDQSPAEAEPPEQEEEESEETDDAEIADEDLTRLSKKTFRRVKRLLSVIDDKNAEIETLKPRVEQFDRMVKMVSDTGLSASEVDFLLTGVGQNLKRNPAEAYKQLTPIYQRLQVMFGDVLPPELDQQVRTGKITREAAQAIVRNQTNAALATQEAERVRKAKEAEDTERNTDAHVDRIRTAATEWETSQAKADPDWKHKAPEVMEQIELELNRFAKGNEPLTPEKSIEIANKAKKTVDDRYKRFVPKPTEVRPATEVAATASTPKPATALEAAKLELAKLRK